MLINAFLWYYLTLNIITGVSRNFNVGQPELLSLHSLGVIIAGAIGVVFSKNRYRMLLFWTFLGTIMSLLPLIIPISVPWYFQLFSFAWGFSFGLGMPSSLGYFSENISIEDRGRLSGIVFLVSLSCAIPIAGLGQLFGLSVLFLVAGFWRILGFIPLLILHSKGKFLMSHEKSKEHIVLIAYDKRLFLYFIPWLMFNIIDNLEGVLLRNFMRTTFPDYYALLQLMHLLFLSIFAFLGGLFSDLVGRKPVMILGFATMGIAYAVISVTPTLLPAWFFYSIAYGLALGVFYTIFITLIWGDLAPKGSEEAYYFIGNLPWFLATIIQILFASYMTFLNETSAFSLAAIFLFLAVLPILFAPETLPEKKIRERELKKYVEKAKKVKEKYA
jgi:MFS family permease